MYVSELASNLGDTKSADSIFCGLVEFREHLGGELAIMLLRKLGEGLEVNQVNIPIYRQAILMLQEIEVTTGS